MSESRSNRHARANVGAASVTLARRAPGAEDRRTNDERRAYAASFLDSELPEDRARGREIIAEQLSVGDAATIFTLVGEELSAHPGESRDIIDALSRYITRTGWQFLPSQKAIGEALCRDDIAVDQFALLIARWPGYPLAADWQQNLARRAVAVLSLKSITPEERSQVWGWLSKSVRSPVPEAAWDDEHPGGAILHPLVNDSNLPEEWRVDALETWMWYRDWPREKIARVDATLDPALRFPVLLGCPGLDLLRRVGPIRHSTLLDAPLLEQLLQGAASSVETTLARRSREILSKAVQGAPLAGISREEIVRQVIAIVRRSDLALSARRRLLQFALNSLGASSPARLRELGIVIEHPGEDAPLDVLLIALSLGATPHPEDLSRIAKLLQQIQERVDRNGSLPEADQEWARFALQALRSSTRRQLSALAPDGNSPMALLCSDDNDLGHLGKVAREIAHLAPLFSGDSEAWTHAVRDPTVPHKMRITYLHLLRGQPRPSYARLLRALLTEDSPFGEAVTSEFLRVASAAAFVAAVKENPVAYAARRNPPWSRLAVQYVLDLLADPSVQEVTELRAALNHTVLVHFFGTAWTRSPSDAEIRNLRLPVHLLSAICRDGVRSNPLTMIDTCLKKSEPETQEFWRQLFLSSAIRFPVVRHLTKSSMRSLDPDFLLALLRTNEQTGVSIDLSTRAVLRELLLNGDLRVGLESLQGLKQTFPIGKVAMPTLKERLLAFGSRDLDDRQVAQCRWLWSGHCDDPDWPTFLRIAYQNPRIRDDVLFPVSDLTAIARAWRGAPEAERTETLRRRLLSGCVDADGSLKSGKPLLDGERSALHELAADSPERAACLLRDFCAIAPTAADPALRDLDLDELLTNAASPDLTDAQRVSLLREGLRRPGLYAAKPFPLIRLLVRTETSDEVRALIHRVVERFGGREVATLLDVKASPQERANAAGPLRGKRRSYGRWHQASQQEVRFVLETLLEADPPDPDATRGLRRLLWVAGISHEGKDDQSSLSPAELGLARRWIDLDRAGRLSSFWSDPRLAAGESEADARLLVGSLLAWGSVTGGNDPRDFCQGILDLPLSVAERGAALRHFADAPSYLASAATNQTLIRLAWGADPQEFQTVAREILEKAMQDKPEGVYQETRYALATHPDVPSNARCRALTRLSRYQKSHAQLAVSTVLLDPALTDAEREQALAVVTGANYRVPCSERERDALLAMIRDRGRTIGVRTGLVHALRLLDVVSSEDPPPVHAEGGEAVAAVDPRLDAARANLWEILADNRLPQAVRSSALAELLHVYEVPDRALFQRLIDSEGAPAKVRWLLRQLRAVNCLPNRAWRDQIIRHRYHREVGLLQEQANRLAHVPEGLAMYAADVTGDRPSLAASIEHAFSARRGAVATSAAVGTWLGFLSLVADRQGPQAILDLFQGPSGTDVDDPTPLAESVRQWIDLGRNVFEIDVAPLRDDGQRTFIDRARALDAQLYQHVARQLAPEASEEHLGHLERSLRVVTPQTPAPIVLTGHYRLHHPEGLPLLGAAVSAWVEGSWLDFKYARTENRTLAALPEKTVAAWRSPLGFAVPQVTASPTFVTTAETIGNLGQRLIQILAASEAAEWSEVCRFALPSGATAERLLTGLRELEDRAEQLGKELARQSSREAADACRRKIRRDRFLANLARFAFLDPDALAVNELRASGEHNHVLPNGSAERKVSVLRAFERLRSQARELDVISPLGPGLDELEQMLRRLPEFPERADLIVETRDDFPTLIEIGARPYGSGSCQNFRGDGEFNKALLAYVCDGDKQAIVVREARIVTPGTPPDLRARAILRLGRTPSGEPALLLEPIYASGGRGDQLRREIEALARQKAAALQAVLLRAGSGEVKETIQVAPSRNGFQYEDSYGSLHGNMQSTGYSLTLPVLADFRVRA